MCESWAVEEKTFDDVLRDYTHFDFFVKTTLAC